MCTFIKGASFGQMQWHSLFFTDTISLRVEAEEGQSKQPHQITSWSLRLKLATGCHYRGRLFPAVCGKVSSVLCTDHWVSWGPNFKMSSLPVQWGLRLLGNWIQISFADVSDRISHLCRHAALLHWCWLIRLPPVLCTFLYLFFYIYPMHRDVPKTYTDKNMKQKNKS